MGGSLYSLRAVSGADDSRAFSAGLASTKLAPEGARLTMYPGRGEEAGTVSALNGSEKQVAWAEEIRGRISPVITRALAMLVPKPGCEQKVAALRAKVEAWAEESSAHAWIERADALRSMGKSSEEIALLVDAQDLLRLIHKAA